jgi:glycosyltransferase involved in cell wall biosynthesis
MFLSVIVPTYRRPNALAELLTRLRDQEHRDFEVLVAAVEDDTETSQTVERFRSDGGSWSELRLVRAPRGRCRQRNAALPQARGEAICFFDDDITFGADFLRDVEGIFAADTAREIGGITPYESHYGDGVPRRIRVQRAAGIYASLEPGAAGRCGVPVPLLIAPPFRGCRDVTWLAGFCMIFRREALRGLSFDERLDWGEDILLSSKVAEKWRLRLCGDISVTHHVTDETRATSAQEWYGCNYAVALRHLGASDGVRAEALLLWYALVELGLDAAGLLRHPSRDRLAVLLAKPAGLLSGRRQARLARSA